jgi:hypothetical protein
MQKVHPTSCFGILAALVLILAGVIAFASVIPSSERTFLGAGLLGIGVFNILLHRRFGRQSYEWRRYMPASVSSFWEYIGEGGARLLYLGTGVILALVGCVLLAASLRNSQ